MDKKLPKVFANKIDKELRNNEKVYYEKNEVNIEPLKEEKTDEFTLNQKINKIIANYHKNINNRCNYRKFTAIFCKTYYTIY